MLPARLLEILSQRRALWLTVALSVVLLLPALATGWVVDDHLHRVMLADDAVDWIARGPHELYSFMLADPVWQRGARAAGALPWFADPEMHASLWRPLSSVLRYLDHVLAPDTAVWAHLHSIAWYAALVAVVGAVYRRLLPGGWVAGLAVLMFAVDDSHGFGVAWIANRYALVSLFFATLALLFHLRWRQQGSRAAAWLAPLCLALGLLAGEIALCVSAYLFAFALILDPLALNRGSLGRRLATLLPGFVVVVIWRLAYSLQGFGVSHSAMYVDPLRDPPRFVLVTLERLPLLLQGQLLPVAPELFVYFAPTTMALFSALAAAVVALLLVVCWRYVGDRRRVTFFVISMVLSAIPMCATMPHERLLLPLGIAGSGLVAHLVSEVVEARRRGQRRPRPARWLAAVWLVCHLWLAALMLPLKAYSARLFGAAFESAAQSLGQVGDLEGRTVMFVNGPNFFYTSWAPAIRLSLGLSTPARHWVLGSTEDVVEVTTVDTHTLRLRPSGGYVNNILDELLRSADRPFRVGDLERQDDLSVEVTAVTPEGRPAEVICRLSKPLDDPSILLAVWTRDHGYQRFVPAPVGETARTEAVTKIDLTRYAIKTLQR